MRMRWFNTLVLVALVLGTLPFAAPSSALATAPVDNVRDNETVGIVYGEIEGTTEPSLYIVQLHAPALASYSGGIPSLAATTPLATGAERLDPQAPASVAYLNYLQAEQRDALAAVEATLNRSVEMAYQYLAALNGFAVRLSPQEAARVAGLPQVRAVYRDVERELDTDVGPLLIGAPAIWNGDTGLGVATRGEGIVIGVLDTGINPQHPSFAATDGDGYAHTNPYGAGIYKGWCASNPGFCNEKLIAAYTFHSNGGSPVDTNGHGSHTAGTAGGNAHTATFDVGNETYNIPIQGVAPRANIVAYKVCDPGCPSTASVAAVNSAILNDDVDVLNYSISGGDSPWTDAVDLAFLDAHNAGIFVSASAGNSGSGPNTVAKTGPWNASVAASTHNRAIVQTLDVTGPTAPAELQGLAAVPGENTAILVNITGELRYDPGNNLGCTPFAAGTFTGSLALIQRGGCTFNEKVNNAVAAGATHVVIFNSVGGPPISMGGLTGTPPAVMLDLAGGAALRDYVVANAGTTVRINAATSLVYEDDWTDIVAGFSSRGPSQFELLKPDYIAPGVNILAAVESQGGDPVQYGFQQGTSMSSPHAAGAAALMMALHPTWSPSEIKSALASTAVSGLTKEDGLTPADPFDVGSGRLDLSLASTTGLVFSETGANYLAANPATGGDPKTLNQPSLVSYNCVGTCSWTRTVKSVLGAPATYSAVATAPVGMVVTVTPSTFTIAPGATQELEITVAVTGMTPGSYAFASIALETAALQGGMAVANTHIPIVLIPTADAPLLTLDPAEVTSNQGTNMTVDKILTIGNEGGVDLEWEVTENLPAGMSLPVRATTPVATATPGVTSHASTRITIGDDFLSTNRTADVGMSVIPMRGQTPFSLTTLTHSASQAITGGNAVACSPDGGATTSVNQYLRTFTLEDFAIYGDFDVTEVSFGIENLSGAVNRDIVVNLYTLDGAFTYANLTSIGTATASVAPQQLTVVAVPVTGTAPAGSTLVVEIVPGDLSGAAAFFIGSNTAGQTAPSYLASVSCGMPEPTSFAAIGFSNVHVVMNVTGDAEAPVCDAPGAVDWVNVAPVLGTVAPSGTQDVTVTFDSTGLGVGEYNANLCIASNDPAHPLALVPLTLEVLAEPQIEVGPDPLISMQGVGTRSNLMLDISNRGLADLEWFVEEAAPLAGVSPAGPIPSAVLNLPVGGDRATPTLAGVSAPASIMPTGSPVHLYGWSESFDDIALLPGQGWALINNSAPLGTSGWFQGNTSVFGSHSGTANAYIGANFNNVAGANTISNWLLTPETVLNNGDTFSFWTRRTGSQWQDRLQVRLSTAGAGTNVGTSATSVGDFTELLMDINPTYGNDYPAVWTEYVITISGLSGQTNGRLAFRYFVENGGPSGSNSDYIGIDTVAYTPALPKMLYDNGPFVTSYGDGPGGSDVSLLQNVSLGMTTLGAAVYLQTGDHFRIADAFTVDMPGGWSIDNVSFYAYQTGSPITSTLTSVNYRIWDGPPNDPASTVLFGDTTTNRIVDTSSTGVYRYAENGVGTTRPIMSVIGEAGLHLEPGTYWLDWQLDGSLASGPWQPPITRLGETTTGNALQLLSSGWVPYVDGGLSTSQGAPFKLWGKTVCDLPSDVSWLSVSPAGGTTLPGETDQVIVTLDSTDLAVGDYTAYLCVNSNDVQNPVMVVPVTLEVVEVYTLDVTVDPAEGGTVQIDPDQDTYFYGDEVTLTATAAPGWRFAGWSGDATGTNPVTTVTIEGDTAITAAFEQEAYTLDVFVTPSGAGTVAIAPDQGTYFYGAEVTLTATAAPGWVFSGWSGDATGTNPVTTVTIEGDTAVVATFTEEEIPVYRIMLPLVRRD